MTQFAKMDLFPQNNTFTNAFVQEGKKSVIYEV